MRTAILAKLVLPDWPARDAVALIHRWRKDGVIGPGEKTGSGRTSSFFYPKADAAAVAVLAHIYDRLELADIPSADRSLLRAVYGFLTTRQNEGQPPHIDAILADILDGRDPYLILTRWRHLADDRRLTSIALRLGGEHDQPIHYPSAHFELIGDLPIDLAPILARFVGANIVEMAVH